MSSYFRPTQWLPLKFTLPSHTIEVQSLVLNEFMSMLRRNRSDVTNYERREWASECCLQHDCAWRRRNELRLWLIICLVVIPDHNCRRIKHVSSVLGVHTYRIKHWLGSLSCCSEDTLYPLYVSKYARQQRQGTENLKSQNPNKKDERFSIRLIQLLSI